MPLTRSNKVVESKEVPVAAVLESGWSGPMTDCVERYLYVQFPGVPVCVLREYQCFFFVRLSQRWGKHIG